MINLVSFNGMQKQPQVLSCRLLLHGKLPRSSLQDALEGYPMRNAINCLVLTWRIGLISRGEDANIGNSPIIWLKSQTNRVCAISAVSMVC